MPDQFIDELTPIAKFMAAEMTHNPRTRIARQIFTLNSTTQRCVDEISALPWWQKIGFDPTHCVAQGIPAEIQAMVLWYGQVKYDGPWDHKPQIKRRADLWSRTGDTEYHIYGDVAYNHDVWSNIHYGYVGLAVGFDADILLDGAGAAQFRQDLKGGWPRNTGPWMLPRSWDRAEDRVSIRIGIELYKRMPKQMIADVLVREITKAKGLGSKPSPLLQTVGQQGAAHP